MQRLARARRTLNLKTEQKDEANRELESQGRQHFQRAPTSRTSSLPPEIIGLQSELIEVHLLHGTLADVSPVGSQRKRKVA